MLPRICKNVRIQMKTRSHLFQARTNEAIHSCLASRSSSIKYVLIINYSAIIFLLAFTWDSSKNNLVISISLFLSLLGFILSALNIRFSQALPISSRSGERSRSEKLDRNKHITYSGKVLESENRSFVRTVDALTGLKNTDFFLKMLSECTFYRRDLGHVVALFVVDVRKLRKINKYYGFRVGDSFLRQLARRMVVFASSNATVCRLGGNSFAVVYQHLNSSIDAQKLAENQLRTLTRSLYVDGYDITPEINIGVATFPEHGKNVEHLIRCAKLAVDEARKKEGSHVGVFENDMDAILKSRRTLERELRRAMSERTLILHYQPQFGLRNNEIVGVEALMRWPHPEWGMVPPSTFIPVAESTGLIRPMGVWLLRQACQQLVEWTNSGHNLRMAVNISAAQLRQPEFAQIVADCLDLTGCDASRLELEVTESLFVDPSEVSIRICLNKLDEMGVHLAIDDFGTGYSSLAYLKRLPVGKIKIDKSFVSDLGTNSMDQELVRAIIGLAKTFGKEILAEGVEDAQQNVFLRDEGCDQAQGYYFAKPMDARSCSRFLNDRKYTFENTECA